MVKAYNKLVNIFICSCRHFYGSIEAVLLVHGPDPENLDIGTIRGGNLYHTFLESQFNYVIV